MAIKTLFLILTERSW